MQKEGARIRRRDIADGVDPYAGVRAHIAGRRAADTGQSRASWFQQLAQSGFSGSLTGDYAKGLAELLCVSEIVGGYPAPLSLAPVAAAGGALASAGTATADGLLKDMLAGGAPVLPALQRAAVSQVVDAGSELKTQVGRDGSFTVTGMRFAVPDAQEAQAFIAEAETSEGIVVFLFTAAAQGLQFQLLPAADGTRLGAFVFEAMPVEGGAVLARGAAARDMVERMRFAVQLGLATDLCGLGAALMTRAGAAYAAAHDIADVLMDLSLARSLAFGAAGLAQPGRPHAPEIVAGARAKASEAALAAARLALATAGDSGQAGMVGRLARRTLVLSRIYQQPEAHKLQFTAWSQAREARPAIYAELHEAAARFSGNWSGQGLSAEVSKPVKHSEKVRALAEKSAIADDGVYADEYASVELDLLALVCADAQGLAGGERRTDFGVAALRRVRQRLADCALHAAGTHGALAEGNENCAELFIAAYA